MISAAPAPYATRPGHSRGRLHPEPESPTRSVFQRDRDRIFHSTAFRRLEHKTQVFVHHEGDHYRTRLTHSLEVAQIARSASRELGLDEDLVEALALAHDLGHTPFGHAGEDALNAAMAPFGGFDHNAQALRVLTAFERRYAAFDGLNLTWETLEGVAKHNGPVDPAAVPETLAAYNRRHDLELHTFAGPEAQVAALADDIAYCNHDIDDAVRAGLFGGAPRRVGGRRGRRGARRRRRLPRSLSATALPSPRPIDGVPSTHPVQPWTARRDARRSFP